ncbi:flagellar biosynthesis protein FlhF [Phycisphaerales bacterium AB-hyl4]|uniref:Flagellar biosynthesis protein FlhF n=1 Tax=Natronomicrosphaera hydrolytica TaxID=3242702 RepID=A0ABV4U4Z5_9BACT
MNLRTFTARTMAEALVHVRRTMGADAVILHTRSYKRGGILGIGAKAVVEVTAADGREVGRKKRSQAVRDRQEQLAALVARRKGSDASPRVAAERLKSLSRVSERASEQRTPEPVREPEQPAMAGDLIRRTYAAARAEFEQSQTPVQPAVQASVATLTPEPTYSNDQLADEMRAIKRMVAQMMTSKKQRQVSSDRPDVPDKLFDQYLALLEQEVTEELAEEIVDQVRGQLSDDDLDDEQACRKAVMEAVAGILPTGAMSKEQSATPDDGRPRTIALVGPTGVGKTTTIAKLAATFKLKQKKKVGLITLDTYRIAAVDQLRTYAGIIGVPLRVAMSPDELEKAIDGYRDCDVVLIDTAGRSQRDDPRLGELQSFIAAAKPHEVHLVLSSTCTQKVLEDTIERFARIHTDRIIFTKLDEAVTFGVVLNVMRKVRKRLSYITTGQEVPHQIEPGRPDRLAALVLGEGVVQES